MSQETLEWLNQNTLIGFTSKRGNAWHWRASAQGAEPNHYENEIPLEDVRRRLFSWTADDRKVYVEIPATVDDCTGIDDEGNPVKLVLQTDWKAIVRSDTNEVFQIPTAGWKAHQADEWCIGNTQEIIGKKNGLWVASAGALKGGRIVWLSIETPENVKTPEGMEFRPFLTAKGAFDGTGSSTWFTGSSLPVCDNTLFLAEGNATGRYSVRHTRNSEFHVSSARQALGILDQQAEGFSNAVANLAKWNVSTRAWNNFLDASVPVDESVVGRGTTMAINKRDRLSDLYNYDTRVAPWKGTALGVVQAVNTYNTHDKIVRGAHRAERAQLNALNGLTAKLDAEALATLARFAPAPKLVLAS